MSMLRVAWLMGRKFLRFVFGASLSWLGNLHFDGTTLVGIETSMEL